MKEQERKYLLKYLPDGLTKQRITQGYLMLEGNKNLRIRIVDDSICYLTYKIFHSDEIRTEYEYQIPLNDGIEMLKSTNIKVSKTRYKTTHNDLNVDIDIYDDDWRSKNKNSSYRKLVIFLKKKNRIINFNN